MRGDEHLQRICDGREVWLDGERIHDVAAHPAFDRTALAVSDLYDSLGRSTEHPFFSMPESADDLRAARDAIMDWQRRVHGWMLATPDYGASLTGTLEANAAFYAPYDQNAARWHRKARDELLDVHLALACPVTAGTGDLAIHVERETDTGLVVSGVRPVATNACLGTHALVAPDLGTSARREHSSCFIVPLAIAGLRILARRSQAYTAWQVASPFDAPLSSRYDENDAVLVFDQVEVPWENVLLWGDVERAHAFRHRAGHAPRCAFHALARLAVRFDFICGLLLKALDVNGTMHIDGVRTLVSEVLAMRHVIHALGEAAVTTCEPWLDDSVQPAAASAHAYRVVAPAALRRVRAIAAEALGSSLIYLNSHAVDFETESLRPSIDRYLRGTPPNTAMDRVKIMKLLWDAVGSEFASRQVAAEQWLADSLEGGRRDLVGEALADGSAEAWEVLVEDCLSSYNTAGWTGPSSTVRTYRNPIEVQERPS